MKHEKIHSLISQISTLQASLDDAEVVRQIQDRLIGEYRDFIVSMVQKAEAKKKISDDALQDSYLGFIEALRNYDLHRGVNYLFTYIGRVIVWEVRTKEMRTSSGSASLAWLLSQIGQAADALAAEGEDIDADSICEWLRRKHPEKRFSLKKIDTIYRTIYRG